MNRKLLFFGLWTLLATLLIINTRAGTFTVGATGQATAVPLTRDAI